MVKEKTCGDYGGMTNRGKPCKRGAGDGTDHRGEGRCSQHEISFKEKYGIHEKKIEMLAASGLPINAEDPNAPDIKGFYGISQGTWHNITDKHPEIREAYHRGKAQASADIGKTLYERAKNGDITAQKFYLKCQAGWKPSERKELSGPGGGPIETRNETEGERLDYDRLSKALSVLAGN